jgi:hypothetical protein
VSTWGSYLVETTGASTYRIDGNTVTVERRCYLTYFGPGCPLDTRGIVGSANVDKSVPATVKYELRFDDAALAQTAATPSAMRYIQAADENFTQTIPLTAPTLSDNATSVLHPDQAEAGVHYWYGEISADASSLTVNPIKFVVGMDPDAAMVSTPVRATSQVVYTLYP